MIYVDDMFLQKGKARWCHLIADNLDELHTFAQSIGLKREWCHNGYHYDVTELMRAKAIRAGAVSITVEEALPIAKKLRRLDLIDLTLAGAEEPGEGMEMTRAAYGVGE